MKPLSLPRQRALHNVDIGAITYHDGKWYQKGWWQPLNGRAYTWALEHDLIEVIHHRDISRPSWVRLLAKGKDVLDGKAPPP